MNRRNSIEKDFLNIAIDGYVDVAPELWKRFRRDTENPLTMMETFGKKIEQRFPNLS